MSNELSGDKHQEFYKAFGKFRGLFFVNPQLAVSKQCILLEIYPS